MSHRFKFKCQDALRHTRATRDGPWRKAECTSPGSTNSTWPPGTAGTQQLFQIEHPVHGGVPGICEINWLQWPTLLSQCTRWSWGWTVRWRSSPVLPPWWRAPKETSIYQLKLSQTCRHHCEWASLVESIPLAPWWKWHRPQELKVEQTYRIIM